VSNYLGTLSQADAFRAKFDHTHTILSFLDFLQNSGIAIKTSIGPDWLIITFPDDSRIYQYIGDLPGDRKKAREFLAERMKK